MDPAYAAGDRPVTRVLRSGEVVAGESAVAVEAPVQVLYGGVPFAVMMATPRDLEDFALGFSLTEGVVDSADEVRAVAVQFGPSGIVLDVTIAPERMHATLARRRTLSGRTGCGVCGISDLDAVERLPRRTRHPAIPIDAEAIGRALDGLRARQDLGRLTGATHAAAWVTGDGIGPVREDVGRHNALDKLVGACLTEGRDAGGGFVLVTSRCSFEMVDKTAAFGARLIVALSGPTSLAIERAQALDVALVAFARPDSLAVFHGADRIAPAARPLDPARPIAEEGRQSS